MVTVQTESWAAIENEIEPVAAFHCKELALDQWRFQRDLDREQYQRLDQMGRLLVVTVRDGKTLVGYAIWFIMPSHMHYKSSGPVAMVDMYFLKREYRHGAGAQMLKVSEQQLRERGVIRAHASYKLHEPHGALFSRLGWKETDVTVSKLLVEEK